MSFGFVMKNTIKGILCLAFCFCIPTRNKEMLFFADFPLETPTLHTSHTNHVQPYKMKTEWCGSNSIKPVELQAPRSLKHPNQFLHWTLTSEPVLSVVFQLFIFYLSKAVGSQVQCVEQSTVLQTLYACQVVVRAAQVEESVYIPQSFGADQLVVIHWQPLQSPHRLQTS